jgi:uncharacterized membrane protein
MKSEKRRSVRPHKGAISMMQQYSKQTSLGLPETVERVGAYLFFWVGALLLLIFEKRNENVRHHARQSLVIFGTLSVIGFLLAFVGGVFGILPLVGGLLALPFHLLGDLVKWISIALWLGLMVAAAVIPRFQVPGTARLQKMLH